jgi:hypothetical protein
MNDIKELRHKLTKLRDRVRFGNLRGADTYKYVLEYHEIMDDIKKLGGRTQTACDYLDPKSYVQIDGKWVYKGNKKTKVVPQKTTNNIIDKQLVPQHKTYTLSILWISSDETKPDIIDRIGDYFNSVGVKYIKENTTQNGNQYEHILKYSFNGDDQSFKLLKRCTQFLLDELSTTKEFNIEIFGK